MSLNPLIELYGYPLKIYLKKYRLSHSTRNVLKKVRKETVKGEARRKSIGSDIFLLRYLHTAF